MFYFCREKLWPHLWLITWARSSCFWFLWPRLLCLLNETLPVHDVIMGQDTIPLIWWVYQRCCPISIPVEKLRRNKGRVHANAPCTVSLRLVPCFVQTGRPLCLVIQHSRLFKSVVKQLNRTVENLKQCIRHTCYIAHPSLHNECESVKALSYSCHH